MRQLLLDANLLVLLVVGLRDRSSISRHKRTKQFAAEDYDALLAIVSEYDRILVTPNVLTEASNHLRWAPEAVSLELMEVLRSLIDDSDERYVPSEKATQAKEFPRLGLTDAAILQIVDSDLPLLTVDLPLYLAAAKKCPTAVENFTYLQPSLRQAY